MARASGALTAAIVNDVESPLARGCEIVLPMAAGPERSIAATKTFVASLAAALRITAAWADDAKLKDALDRLPERAFAAGMLDWGTRLDPLAAGRSLIVLGRGPTLAIAREAALKLKEVCCLHAEAFSGAEFRHGPMALVEGRYPVLVFAPADEGAAGLRELAADLAGKGATVLTAAADGVLATLPADQPEADAICLIQSFYSILPVLAARLGADPDRLRHLQKVTRTR
jgi:glucosamine--fructose-6-phosphate aminotransferase (isomerizing)